MYKQDSKLEFVRLKKFLLNCLNNLKGQNIICIDINKKYSITDLIIICTGQSNRHVISIAQDISYQLKKIGFKFYKIEGLNDGTWILIDLNDIILHIMQQNTRNFYALEKIWN